MSDATAPNVRVAAPGDLTSAEVDTFIAAVETSGEVARAGLRARVLEARLVAMAFDGSELVGVSGLKRPSERHRREIAAGSNVSVSSREYAYELGWVFVEPHARRRGISLLVCDAILRQVGDAHVFATSNTSRTPMHRTLTKLRFHRVGLTWPSARNPGEDLALFVR